MTQECFTKRCWNQHKEKNECMHWNPIDCKDRTTEPPTEERRGK